VASPAGAAGETGRFSLRPGREVPARPEAIREKSPAAENRRMPPITFLPGEDPMLRRTLAALALAAAASADEITLKDGRVLKGDVTSDDGKVVKIELRKGSVTVDKTDVVSIVEKPTAEQEYEARKAKLDVGNARAHLELGTWCAKNDLPEEAVRHFLEAHRLDSSLDAAAVELKARDWHLVDGVWQDPDTYYPALGWLKLGGTWYHPVEHAWRSALADVDRAKSAIEKLKEELTEAKAKAKRAETNQEAERKKLEELSRDLTQAENAVADAQRDLTEAESKEKQAEADVKAAEIAFENSASGEGGNLSALNDLREKRRKHNAAKSAVGKARTTLKTAEKKRDGLIAAQAASQRKLEGLATDLADANAAAANVERRVPAEEAQLAGLRQKAEAAQAAWEKKKGK
jgi:hypothetical protein